MSTASIHPLVRSGVPAGLRAEIVTSFAALESLQPDWDRLWLSDPSRHVFLSWPWVRAWWRAYGGTHELCTPVVRDGPTIVGILPLVREAGALHFLGSPDADYTDILCEPGRADIILEAAFRCLLEAAPPWRQCVIENVPGKSRLAAGLARLRPHIRTTLLPKASCPAVVASAADPDPFERLARKESIRRHDRKLRKLGEVQLRHLETASEIRAHLPNFIAQHIARRALAGDRSLLLSHDAAAFYTFLAGELDPARGLRFAVLEAGGVPVAYHLGFETQGRFVWYKPTFDVDLWHWSPGEVLIGRLLQYASERRLSEFDFTLGDEAFKYRFANVVRPLYRLKLYAPGLRGRCVRALDLGRDRLKRTFPRAATWARRVRNALAAVSIGAAARLLRSLVALDNVALFTPPGPTGESPVAGLDIAAARLSELAAISLEHPRSFGRAYLDAARERLRAGHVCLVARVRGRLAAIAWAGQAAAVPLPDFAAGLRSALAPDAAVIFDSWFHRAEPGAAFPDLECALARHAAPQLAAWIQRRGARGPSGSALGAAGFTRIRQVSVLRIFGRVRLFRTRPSLFSPGVSA